MLREFMHEDSRNWDKWLDRLLFAVRVVQGRDYVIFGSCQLTQFTHGDYKLGFRMNTTLYRYPSERSRCYLDEESQHCQSIICHYCFRQAQILPLIHNMHLSRKEKIKRRSSIQ